MDRIGKVYYINLDYRTDRLAEIESELLTKLRFDRAERFEAIPHVLGIYGCTMSHIELFRKMIKEGWETMMVFEDDVELLTSREEIDGLIEGFLADDALDILCLGNSCGDNTEYNAMFQRCFNTQTTSCYVLKKQFVRSLLECYFNDPSGAMSLDASDPELVEKILFIDVGWLNLQPIFHFVMPKRRQIQQRKSFSDIQNKIPDYKL